MNCKNCVYAKPQTLNQNRAHWLQCSLAAGVAGERVCPKSKAFAIDEGKYIARLLVHPDFGCVQFEPKSC